MRRVRLRWLSSDSAVQVFRNIGNTGANALQITLVSFEMVLSSLEVVIEEDVLEQAFRTMKNLEHFALVGHLLVTQRLPFRWFASEKQFASTLSCE